ncbi:aminotransferase class I/II-fold pyridoxal phosphate-dependent enzyme [Glycomyces harbinensis]|uniref:DNA-binding transcriptional regulator, MocR family, contains an aminotransferase domain n=1 Tax=Glycomyces harbinensis TaxID=58114 RepID=A0A1G7DG75_9ACTN|nr:aminotransferase class I/II-fold pyridoxal phosphate-dependent enzyme [Glycomyces harbinensis]SDE50449.1 DNA-binding transcriptional regulator, MocR family, contains an aminotransferase domain [Glycomyces harbinensis]
MSVQYQITGTAASEIASSVESGVRSGRLAPGRTLPPVRKLAADLGVAPGTVASAYRRLRERGVVETGGRAGTFVRERSSLTPTGMLTVPSGVLDLVSGEPDPGLLPDLNALKPRVEITHGNYRDGGPCPDLLDLARERFAADGVHGELTVTSGALDAFERGLAARLEPGDTVAVEEPTWSNGRDLLLSAGYQVTPVAIDGDGPLPGELDAALASGARAFILTSRGQNPTGAAVSAERAAALRAVLAAHRGVFVIEDDHWAELSQVPLHLVADAADRWMFVRSASKPYGPDLRCAVVAADPDTKARVQGRMAIGHGWVSCILQHFVIAAWTDDAAGARVAHAGRVYAERQGALRESLAEHGIDVWGRSGLNVWIPVADETAAVVALRDAGYAVSPGRGFSFHGAQSIRVSTARLAPELAPKVAAAIASASGPASPPI